MRKSLETQFGKVYFELCANEYIIEFLSFNFDPIIPPHMSIETCCCGIFRIKAKEDFLPCSIKCYLETEDKSLEIFPESGESLAAITFKSNLKILSIGTQDEERLQARAQVGNWLPKRIASEINSETIEYISNGIVVNLPRLLKDEVAQVHFIITSASNTPETQCATWFAVDQNIIKMFPDL